MATIDSYSTPIEITDNSSRIAKATFTLNIKGYIYKNIGEVICYVPKDHSTIIYRVRRAKSHYDLEPDFRDMVDKVSNSLMEYKTKISLAKV